MAELALLKFAVGVDVVAQAPSPETWNTEAAPVSSFTSGAPTTTVVPPADIATISPNPPFEVAGELVRVAVGLEVVTQEVSLVTLKM
jgi:hypothetical protein